MASSSTLKFELKVQGQPNSRFRVHEFSLNEAISECFVLRLQAATDDPSLKYDDLISKSVTLTVIGSDFEVTHHGMLTEYTQYPDHSKEFGRESYSIELVIEPRVKQLEFSGQNRIFQKQKTDDIIKAVLKGHNLDSNTRFDLRQALRTREYTVQYNETDWNFISRLMEEEGIFFYFDHEGDSDYLVIADHVEAIRPLPHTPKLVYHQEGGLSHMAQDHISHVRREQRLVTKSSKVKDYNERTPRSAILASSAGSHGIGERYEYSPHLTDSGSASKWAGTTSDSHQALRVVLIGRGIARALRPGYRFELEDESNSPFEGKYTVLRVKHLGDQREGFEGDQARLNYSCEFSCIPSATVFRPQHKSLKPMVPGVLLARVDGPEGEYAFLDEEGRYHAKMPFDLSDEAQGKASLPIRLNQPSAGPGYGMHFPLHNGNDIVLSFVNGDIDRPIVLGAIPNPSNASPVSSRNKSESVIKTASGHILRMDDLKDKTIVDLVTSGKHKLALNDDKEHQEIRLETTGKNEIVLDDKNKNIRLRTANGAHLIKMDSEGKSLLLTTKYGHQILMDDEKKTIVLQTKDGHTLKLDDAGKLLTLQDGKGKHTIQIDAGGGKVILKTDGDMEFNAKGALNVEAKEINFNANQGAINVKAMKDVVLDGMNVSAAAKQKLTLEAKLDAEMSGLNTKIEAKLNLDLKGGLQTKVAGTMASLEGSAITQVKGAMVMLN